jgi:F0F1-type ATP synthase assembly protein I
MSQNEDKSLRKQMYTYGNLGLEMLVAVFVGAFGGYLLDRWLHTRPWLLLVGFVLGAAAGYRNIFKLMAAEGKKENGNKKSGTDIE